MGKKIAIAVLIILVMLVVGVWQFSKNITFSGTSKVTVNGEETTTYSADVYYKELREKIDAFYAVLNEQPPLSKAKSSEIDSKAQRAKATLKEIEQFINSVDKVSGKGSAELKSSVSGWIIAYNIAIDDSLPELSKVMGEDGKVESEAEATKANTLIQSWEIKGEELATNINDALDKFYTDNGFQEK